MNIVLKPRALKNLAAIERYLESEFGGKVKEKFILRLREVLYLLSKNLIWGKSIEVFDAMLLAKRLALFMR